MSPVECIIVKRDGGALPASAIAGLVQAYTRGEVPDYQMSAFLMAGFLNGFSSEETAALTDAMLHSGVVLDLSGTPGAKVDKHSTGGVGDKVSLLLAPLVASCGVQVPMISGRALGHTGGTLDKLESIPGLRTDLSTEEYKRQLGEVGVVMIGQTEEIAPADKKLYALRDVTGTVEFVPFIAASIMSKKLAEGIDALVLDVKCGRGAFMKTEADARHLAETLVEIGKKAGTPTVALMTRMDAPLGRAVGNWPEVAESARALCGEADGLDDLMEVTLALAGEMLALAGEAATPAEGRRKAEAALQDGSAFAKLQELVRVQGGDASVLDNPDTRDGAAPVAEVRAPEGAAGCVAGLDALAVGHAALALGAGRRTAEDAVDPTAGLYLEKKPGDAVRPGDVLARLCTQDAGTVEAAQRHMLGAYSFSEKEPAAPPMLMGRCLGKGKWADQCETTRR